MRHCIALAMAALWATPGHAADPADWALPDAAITVVLRGADTFADRLDALEARFAGAAGFVADLKAARALEYHGLRPGERAWLPGGDPARGVAIFASPTPRVRIVMGVTDGAALRESIAAFARGRGFELAATADGFAGPMPMTCVEVDGLMICDNQPPPKTAPGAPPGFDPGAWLTARVDGGMLTSLPPPWGLMVKHAQLDVHADPGRVAIRAAVRIRPDAQPVYGQLRAAMNPAAGASATEAIHPRTPYLLKLSLDAAKLVELLAQGDAGPEAQALRALAARWTGELALSFVGGFAEPVLTLGLVDGATAADLLGALRAMLPEGARPDITADRLVFRIPGEGEDLGESRLILAHRTVGRHLLVGIDPIDLARVEREKGLPPNLPPALAARGAHGSFMAHAPHAAATGLPAFFEADGESARALTGFFGWLAAELRLMDAVSSIVRFEEDGLAIELNWSRL